MSRIGPANEPDPSVDCASGARADREALSEPSVLTPEANEVRTKCWQLFAPAAERVIEWYRQRAQQRPQDL